MLAAVTVRPRMWVVASRLGKLTSIKIQGVWKGYFGAQGYVCTPILFNKSSASVRDVFGLAEEPQLDLSWDGKTATTYLNDIITPDMVNGDRIEKLADLLSKSEWCDLCVIVARVIVTSFPCCCRISRT